MLTMAGGSSLFLDFQSCEIKEPDKQHKEGDDNKVNHISERMPRGVRKPAEHDSGSDKHGGENTPLADFVSTWRGYIAGLASSTARVFGYILYIVRVRTSQYPGGYIS